MTAVKFFYVSNYFESILFKFPNLRAEISRMYKKMIQLHAFTRNSLQIQRHTQAESERRAPNTPAAPWLSTAEPGPGDTPVKPAEHLKN